MQTAQEIADTITLLANKKGETVKKVLVDSGAGRSLVDNLKKGSMPSADKLYLLANYFDVSIDYLLTGEETNLKAIKNEKESTKMKRRFLNLPLDKKIEAIRMEKGYSEAELVKAIDIFTVTHKPLDTAMDMDTAIGIYRRFLSALNKGASMDIKVLVEPQKMFFITPKEIAARISDYLNEPLLMKNWCTMTTQEQAQYETEIRERATFAWQLNGLMVRSEKTAVDLSDYFSLPIEIINSWIDGERSPNEKIFAELNKLFIEFDVEKEISTEIFLHRKGITDEKDVENILMLIDLMKKKDYNAELVNEFIAKEYNKK